MRYVLRIQGPDNSSTYPECWGSQPRGREVARSDRLVDLIDAVSDLGHDTVCLANRLIAQDREEFFALPAVKKAIKQKEVADSL